MVRRRLRFAFCFALVSSLAAAQPQAPVVTMSVTLPDGRTRELTAAESGLATVQLHDGSEYGFRPTIQDSSPWNRFVITTVLAGWPRIHRILSLGVPVTADKTLGVAIADYDKAPALLTDVRAEQLGTD